MISIISNSMTLLYQDAKGKNGGQGELYVLCKLFSRAIAVNFTAIPQGIHFARFIPHANGQNELN